jgi:hypothetical protein
VHEQAVHQRLALGDALFTPPIAGERGSGWIAICAKKKDRLAESLRNQIRCFDLAAAVVAFFRSY